MNKIIFTAALMLAACSSQASEWVSISQYEKATDGQYYSEDVVCTGTNLHVSTQMGALMVQLNVTDEMLQRSLLARGVAIAIDPEGKKSENIQVVFPSAMMGRPQPGQGGPQDRQGPSPEFNDSVRPERQAPQQGQRPDGNPMLERLNQRGALLVIGTDSVSIPKESARISVDEDKIMSFTAVVPLDEISLYTKVGKKWKFGILSQQMDLGERPQRGQRPDGAPSGDRQGPPPGGGMGGPGGGMGGSGGGMGGPGGGMGGPGGGRGPRGGGSMDLSQVTDTKLEKALTKEINEWVTIKYSDFQK